MGLDRIQAVVDWFEVLILEVCTHLNLRFLDLNVVDPRKAGLRIPF